MRSALYEGVVRHRRHASPAHEIRFRSLWVYLDLEEGDRAFAGSRLWGLERRALVSLRRPLAGDGGRPLVEAVRATVEARTGRRPEGRVGLLAMPRFAGLGFDPVRFFYVGDAGAPGLSALVAEVTNTPWHERHVYVATPEPGTAPGGAGLRAELPKAFHVSPFLPMDLRYRFRVRPPGPRLGLALEVRRGGAKVFEASLALRRREMDGAALWRALPRVAVQPARVLAGIYAHALRLHRKGAAFHPHPHVPSSARASVTR
ncbi:MAG: DUF1365 domain-containing protein [Myxococcota bacterium]|nr:DUF1365 domain-containing protein [Myxococcota bacterium]